MAQIDTRQPVAGLTPAPRRACDNRAGGRRHIRRRRHAAL